MLHSRPINVDNGIYSSPVERNPFAFRFPDGSLDFQTQYPAPSPFNYGDKVSRRRQGLFPEYSHGKKSINFFHIKYIILFAKNNLLNIDLYNIIMQRFRRRIKTVSTRF